MFFSCCDSVLGDSLEFHQGNRGSYVFDWEHGTTQHALHGNRTSSCGEGKSHEFSVVPAGTWCIFSSYGGDGHLKLRFVPRSQDTCLVMTDNS